MVSYIRKVANVKYLNLCMHENEREHTRKSTIVTMN